MAQTSTSILSSKSHIADVTGTDISFNATGSTYKITSTSTSLNGFAVRDLITVSGTTNNNSTFTVLARSYGPPIHSNVHNEPMYVHAYTAVIFDVTNTSNCKFRLNYSCQTSSNTIIGGGYNATHVTVTRLGDT